ncbi:MAG: hypothetical protein HETSPECPRED_006202 [Heterodermia speciosa]|uniref:Uncharacterized protein n=1 Tax=Heterodermia speciosa TaxID=116794 RepID=A0A8H3FQ97_9LECA|nr:MAG: hypothetical protein HETSPECPRED_006202 [Heterodermia speciosa]
MILSTAALSLVPFLSLLTPIFAAPAPTATKNSPATLVKRYSADDATDPAKVKEWMGENIDPENFVFYSDSSVGAPMAKAFCDANDEGGYKYFWYIFDDQFSQDFGGADPNADTEIAKSCSQAMGEYAKGDTRVFNHAGASSTSFWLTIELPALQSNSDVTAIFTMKDSTTDPDDHDSDLKNDAANCDCNEDSCTATSAPCCANGSCTGKREAVRSLETVFKRALAGAGNLIV